MMFNDRGDDAVKPAFSLRDFAPARSPRCVPLVVFVVWAGVYPNTFLNFLHVPVQEILDKVTPSLQSAQAHGLAQLLDVDEGAVLMEANNTIVVILPGLVVAAAAILVFLVDLFSARKGVLAWIAAAGLVAAAGRRRRPVGRAVDGGCSQWTAASPRLGFAGMVALDKYAALLRRAVRRHRRARHHALGRVPGDAARPRAASSTGCCCWSSPA